MATSETTDESTSEDAPASSSYFNAPTLVNQNEIPKSLSDSNGLTLISITKSSYSSGRLKWLRAIEKLQSVKLDPWSDFDFDNCPSVDALRHRYNSLTKKWVQDRITVKMEPLPFDHGAMRECFRLKKLPTQGSHKNNWYYASNYVAKSYINAVDFNVYFEDVKLQMDTKLWAEEFNRHNPPKKIDIFQLSVLQIDSSDDGPKFYHIERFMEGTYCKYNSNSGFVDDTSARNTPHVFSHFTFEKSGHRLLIVDIQGVGDLYTDPQVHTSDGQGYGDGNLGPRGMALFFHSHRCNSLCQWLGLSQFDLQNKEKESLLGPSKQMGTSSRLDQPSPSSPSLAIPLVHQLMGISSLRQRSESLSASRDRMLSIDSGCLSECGGDNVAYCSTDLHHPTISSDSSLVLDPSQCIWTACNQTTCHGDFCQDEHQSLSDAQGASRPFECHSIDLLSSGVSSLALSQHGGYCESNCSLTGDIANHLGPSDVALDNDPISVREEPVVRPSNFLCNQIRIRNISECSELDAADEDYCAFHSLMHDHHKPTCANHSKNLDQEIGQSVLAHIHHEMALLHFEGRFSHSLCDIDWSSILYHEKLAAQLGNLDAIVSLAGYCFQSPKDNLLRDCPIMLDDCDIEAGVEYLIRASEGGHIASMLELAHHLENTSHSGADNQMKEALMWYLRALDQWKISQDTPNSLSHFPMKQYELMARVAQIYAHGTGGVPKNVKKASDFYYQAAESAQNLHKGREATKYFELAEQILDEA